MPEKVIVLTVRKPDHTIDLHGIRGVFSDHYALREYLMDWVDEFGLEEPYWPQDGTLALPHDGYFAWQTYTVDAKIADTRFTELNKKYGGPVKP